MTRSVNPLFPLLLAATCGALSGSRGAAAAGPADPPDSLTEAELMLDIAQQTAEPEERLRMVDRAIALCEQAAKARPRDPEPVMRLVHALTVSEPGHPETCVPGRCERALVELAKLRKLDPLGLDAANVASQEGIILSRMQRFEEALAAYERAMPLIAPSRLPNRLDERNALALVWGNSAETAMGLGRLDEAIRRFELALEHTTYGETEWQLTLYGLGVALDRDGQVERARKTIQRAIERDPGLARLRDDSVFFEPPGDVYYYEGLAHEVNGDLDAARSAFATYLEAQPSSRYAARARTHLTELTRRTGGAVAPPRLVIEIGQPMQMHPHRTQAQLRERIRAHIDELSTCYARALREHPGLHVSLQLVLEISPAGWVGPRAHVLSRTDSPMELSRCVELSAEGWHFPPVGVREDTEQLLVPIDFEPGAQSLPRR